MNEKEYILILSKTDLASLGQVRDLPGLQAAVGKGDEIWVRGIPGGDKLPLNIHQLPALTTYVYDQELLFPIQQQTPVGRLPELDWQPLGAYLPVTPPTSAMPGEVSGTYNVQIVAAQQEHAAAALLTNFDIWQTYTQKAAASRLDRLKFALSSNYKTMILGEPLPSIPGKAYWMRDRLLLPCGYDLALPTLAEVLQKKLVPDEEGYILFQANGAWEMIPNSGFVNASRSAVRITAGLS